MGIYDKCVYGVSKSEFDSMIGLLGDATEDMVDNLDNDKGISTKPICHMLDLIFHK